MSDPLIQEFEAADKQEKLHAYWSEYGGYIIASAILAVLFTGLITGYKNYTRNVSERQTMALVSALENTDRATALIEVSPELDGGLRAMADLSAAGILLSTEKPDEALVVYEKAASDSKLPENFRDLSEFMAIRLKWDLVKTAPTQEGAAKLEINSADYIARLKPLMAKRSSPWQAHANIQAALIMAEEGNYSEALKYINAALNIEKIPPSLQERGNALRHIYTLEQQKNAPAATTAEQEAQG